MVDKHDVRIIDWPEGTARLTHTFDLDRPCPVSIRFEDAPANVRVSTSEQPLNVDMRMTVSAGEPVPVCIKVCEPICARSSYKIGITVFDQPVVQIGLQGETRLFNCEDEEPTKQVCIDFSQLKSGVEYEQPLKVEDLVIAPLEDPIRTSTIGDPADQVKVTFPRTGVRVELPQPSSGVSFDVNNYADPRLNISVFAGTTMVNQFTRMVDRTVATVELTEFDVTAIEVRGGDNEASIIQVCYAVGT